MNPRAETRPPQKSKSNFSTQISDLKQTFALVWETSPGGAFLMFGLSLLQSFLPAASLWTSKLLLDAVASTLKAGGGNLTLLLELLLLQLAVGVAGSLLGTAQNAVRELFSDTLQNVISQKILGKAAKLEVERFENPEIYDALQNAYREVGSRPLGVLTQVISLFQAVITLLSIGVLMSRLGWEILPLVLLATVPSVWVSSKFGLEGYRLIRRRTQDARVQNYLGSLLTSDTLVKEVRLFHFEPYLLERWQQYYRKFRQQLVPLIRARNLWTLAASLFSALMIGGATYLILLRVVRAEISVGDFSLFLLGLAQVQGQFANLLTGFSSLYQHLLYMRNLFEFLELEGRDLEAGSEFTGQIETLEFDRVAFNYPLSDKLVLKDVSFKVQRGAALALVGENGAGKTTIVKLLTRLFEPTSGRILINGVDARAYNVRSLQAAMSIIFQDFGQYQMTVAENISLSGKDRAGKDRAGKDRAGEDRAGKDREHSDVPIGTPIGKALERAGAEFVMDLPSGSETQLGRLFDGGRQLSGGQWQRLALARLYYREASLLVFDEPTAALDARAEYQVVEALKAEASSRITVIISHRFSTVRLADHIVVLEGGTVREEGSHLELIEQDGRYAAMFHLQAKGYV